jgi:hypothetical protein
LVEPSLPIGGWWLFRDRLMIGMGPARQERAIAGRITGT